MTVPNWTEQEWAALNGHTVNLDHDLGGNVLQTRVGMGLNEEILDPNVGVPFSPDFIFAPDGAPEKWYVRQRNIKAKYLSCPYCHDQEPTLSADNKPADAVSFDAIKEKTGILVFADERNEWYVVVQCESCKAYLFVPVSESNALALAGLQEIKPSD